MHEERRTGRRTRGAAAGIATGTALVIASAAAVAVPGTAAAQVRSPVVLGPKPDDRRIDRTVPVRVRVAGRGAGFRVRVNGRDVTRRFGPVRRGVRTALLRRGRDFRPGDVTLVAETGTPLRASHGTDTVRFRVLRRAVRGLRITRRSPGATSGAIHLTARSRKDVVEGHVLLDGRRVPAGPAGVHPDGRGFDVRLGAHHGVRPGRHVVRLEAEHRDGTVAVASTTIAIPRTTTVAGAGPDRQVAVGTTATLDGSSTGAAGAVDHRWTVVEAPKGATPQVGDRSAVDTTFTADLPGRYVLRLRAAPGTPGGADLERSSADETTVSVTPTDDPMGVPIETIDPTGAIRVGERRFAAKASWVRMAVLDAQTLEPLDEAGGAAGIGFEQRDAGALSALVSRLADDESLNPLFILTSPGGVKASAAATAALRSVFAKIGGSTNERGPTADGAGSLDDGPWSLVGSPDLAAGQAWQNLMVREPRVGVAGAGAPGGLSGWLQRVTSDNHVYVSPEFAEIDTQAPGSTATRNVVRIGGRTFPSAEIPAGGKAQGVQLLTFDPSSLAALSSETFTTRGADGRIDPARVQALGTRLAAITADTYGKDATRGFDRRTPPLVVLQSFGATNVPGNASLGNQAGWVLDDLPRWGQTGSSHDDGVHDFYEWCGGSEATRSLRGHTCKPLPADLSAGGTRSARTVTRAVGRIGGLPARLAAANLGRLSTETVAGRKVRRRATEAIAVVGSAHPADVADATVEVGDDGRRVVGTLRRTQQAGWRVATPSTTPPETTIDFDASSMWEVAFRPATPWPLSGGPDTKLGRADAQIARTLWRDPRITSVRSGYPLQTGDDWDANGAELRNEIFCPAGADYCDEFAALKQQLLVEFRMIADVKQTLGNYQGVFGDRKANAVIDAEEIGSRVISEAEADHDARIAAESVEVDQEAVVGKALHFASTVFEALPVEGEVMAGPVGLFGAAWELFSSISEKPRKDAGEVPFDEPRKIRDRADGAGRALLTRFDALNATFDHLLRVFVADPGKLAAATEKTKGSWSLNPGTSNMRGLVQSLAVGTEGAFYEAILPLAYDQFVVSPVQTSSGNRFQKDVTLAGPQDYSCDEGPNPFIGAPDSTVHYSRWEASGGADENFSGAGSKNRNHALGRGLKSKADPLTTQMSDSTNIKGLALAQYTDTKRAGTSPPSELTDRLFRPVTRARVAAEPDGLGMSKDEFFGLPTWSLPRLQCGVPLDRDYDR